MSRELTALNQAEVDSDHLYDVVLAKLEFDTPVYVHSGLGNITYDGNEYLGVGNLGDVEATKETEALGPQPLDLTLDCTDAVYISEALDAGNIYDPVTLYVGYRNDDGTLVDDPWIPWKGFYEFAAVRQGDSNVITVTCQHDLTWLDEKDGGRYSDEDQKNTYASDEGFEFVTDMATLKLFWAGGPVQINATGAGGRLPGDPQIHPL